MLELIGWFFTVYLIIGLGTVIFLHYRVIPSQQHKLPEPEVKLSGNAGPMGIAYLLIVIGWPVLVNVVIHAYGRKKSVSGKYRTVLDEFEELGILKQIKAMRLFEERLDITMEDIPNLSSKQQLEKLKEVKSIIEEVKQSNL